jgi:cell shape-determining protein MreC
MASPTKTKIRKEERNLRCDLTQEEFNEKAKQLAEKVNDLEQLEKDKKRVTADFGAKIQTAQGTIAVLSNVIQTRYEFRNVVVEIHYNDPKNGKKRAVRTDTGQTLGVEDMTPSELQEELDLENEE